MARGDRVPFFARRHLYAAFAEINRAAKLALLIDTGAERMVISRKAALLLGIDLAHPVRVEPLVGVGQTVPVSVIRLDRVQVGGTGVDGLLACVYDLPPLFRADGLIGLNFLSRFRVTLEFDMATLILRPPNSRN